MKRALLLAVGVVLAFVVFTAWALESGGVAVVETQRPDGSTRSTHVWLAHHEGALWLEAGTPENGWFQDVQTARVVWLTLEGHRTRHRAEPIRDPAGHTQIRSLLREQYGVRDWWVALIFDTTRSVAVRLLPGEEAAAP